MPTEKITLLTEAMSAFDQASAVSATDRAEAVRLYGRAARKYEELIRRGVRNGDIYYNQGNAYYRLGDMGRAVLAYRRAQLYSPRDAQLTANLNTARSQRSNRIEEPARNRLIENLLFWYVHTSMRGRLYFAVTVFCVAWLVMIVRLFVPKKPLMGAFAVCLLVSAVVGGSVAWQWNQLRQHPTGVILAEDVIARTGNGVSYQPQFEEKLQPGVEFTLLERRGDWLRIRLPDDQQGWIPADTAETL